MEEMEAAGEETEAGGLEGEETEAGGWEGEGRGAERAGGWEGEGMGAGEVGGCTDRKGQQIPIQN